MAPTPPEVFLDALLALPTPHVAEVSPDGRWLAWSWYRVAPTIEVFVVPTDGSAPPLRLTDSGEHASLAGWAPDSRSVLVLQDRGGDERAQVFRVFLDRPGKMSALTEPAPGYYLRGPSLHPDGRTLVYAATVDERGAEIDASWLYRHDLESGRRVVLARPERPAVIVPKLNRQGSHLLYTRKDRDPGGRQVWLVDLDGREDREIVCGGDALKSSASWFPDGRRALVLSETATHLRLGVWSLDDGSLRWVLDDPAHDILDAHAPPGSDMIVVVESVAGRSRAFLIDPDGGASTPFPAGPDTLLPLAPTPDGRWLARVYGSQQPADLVRSSWGGVEGLSLTRVWDRTKLTSDDLAPAHDYRWRSVDGLEIQGWLYRPAPGRATLGTIVHVHGGPTAHSQDAVNAEIQYFVHCGFNVLDPNYRGSTGFGLAFREAVKATGWGGLEQDDIRTGIEALLRDGVAEPGRVGITGTSYGGYSSWCAITRWPADTLAAAAPVCGMTDLVVDYHSTRPDLRAYSEEMMGGSPDEVPDRYRERSPLHAVGAIRGRLLIVQGERDPNVTPDNVRAVQAALEHHGVPYQLLTFPDEGHGILRRDNQRKLYRHLVEFFTEAFAPR